MELTTTQQIDASMETVWAKLTDFDRFEKMAVKRGTKVKRLDPVNGQPAWEIHFSFRGIERVANLHVSEVHAPERLLLSGEGGGIAAEIAATLVGLSKDRTAMTLAVRLRGRTLVGRSVVQGLKLGKKTIQERFETRVSGIVGELAKTPGKVKSV